MEAASRLPQFGAMDGAANLARALSPAIAPPTAAPIKIVFPSPNTREAFFELATSPPARASATERKSATTSETLIPTAA